LVNILLIKGYGDHHPNDYYKYELGGEINIQIGEVRDNRQSIRSNELKRNGREQHCGSVFKTTRVKLDWNKENSKSTKGDHCNNRLQPVTIMLLSARQLHCNMNMGFGQSN